MPDASYLAWLDLSALGWGDDPAAYALGAREGRARRNGVGAIRRGRGRRARPTQLRVHTRGAGRGGDVLACRSERGGGAGTPEAM